jgi:hypothetical protein
VTVTTTWFGSGLSADAVELGEVVGGVTPGGAEDARAEGLDE